MKSILHLQSALRKIALRAYPGWHRWYVPDYATVYHTRRETPPEDIDLKRVVYLYLDGGTLPAGIDLKKVSYLFLDGGTLPADIDLKRVTCLYLDGGTLPAGIDLKNITYIYWEGGTMTGPPSSWGLIGRIPCGPNDDISNIPVSVLLDAIIHRVKVDLSRIPQVSRYKLPWEKLRGK